MDEYIYDYYDTDIEYLGQQAPEERLTNIHFSPMREYKATFVDHCMNRGPRLSTGFRQLDKALNGGLANELYIMGAESSTGKSAFAMTIAQNIAAKGDADVIYFSLEMGKDEFVARGISALSYEAHKSNPGAKLITAGDVLYYNYQSDGGTDLWTTMPYQDYAPYADKYFDLYGDHLLIVENAFVAGGISANTIKDAVREHRGKFGDRPLVVFVDYLQILAPNDGASGRDRKSKMDAAVITLKALASQIGVPVFTLSSIQRTNYSKEIDTASFKESGDIEYTGGILLGWNWDGVSNEADERERKKNIDICKNSGSRTMTLEVLKYRNGPRNRKIQFEYYPANNWFEECEEGDLNTKAKGTTTRKIKR